MYKLIRSLRIRRLLIEEALVIGIALLIAEIFYKFHSFTLECIAFLATWFVLSWIASKVDRFLYEKGYKPFAYGIRSGRDDK